MRRFVVVACLAVHAATALACCCGTQPVGPAKGMGRDKGLVKGPEAGEQLQAERKKEIDALIARGVLAKVDSRTGKDGAGYADVYVTPAFVALDAAEKKAACKVVHDHVNKMPAEGVAEKDWRWDHFITIKLSTTGKQMGTYAPRYELEWHQ